VSQPDGPTARLAEWTATLTAEDVPPRVRERIALLLLDAVASALAGRHGDETAQVEAVAAEVAPGDEARVIGARRLSRLGATLLNGYQVTAVTVCDVYRPSLCHVTPEVVPPALAMAEGRGVRGRDLVTALGAGLETTVRAGIGIRYASFRDRGWHSPGVIGALGGAVAAGKLAGLDAERMRWALGLAGAQASGTFAQWGTPTIKFHQAHGAVAGLLAATLARERFRSSDEILAHPDGGLFNTYSDGGDPDAMTAGLGEHWELERISMRLWPMASSLQGVVSAVFDLIADHDLRPEHVARMTIRLGEATYALHGEMGWDDRFRGLLSTRYAASVVLHDRACWLDQFEPARIADPAVSSFAAERVVVIEDRSVPAAGAVVEAELTDGGRASVRRDIPKGDADDPLSTDDVVDKFRRAAGGILSHADTEAAVRALLDVEELPDVDAVLDRLAGVA
jgi:2-methylcitrate dehydratase PrpD